MLDIDNNICGTNAEVEQHCNEMIQRKGYFVITHHTPFKLPCVITNIRGLEGHKIHVYEETTEDDYRQNCFNYSLKFCDFLMARGYKYFYKVIAE